MDILLTAGERISMSLLAMAIHNLGVDAQVVHRASRPACITDEAHGKARIIDVTPSRIRDTLARGLGRDRRRVPGRQPEHTNDVTTLGRGGSDTTAVALAAALEADVCEIYTDVDGVFTADPRIVPTARKLDRISYDEMLEHGGAAAPRCSCLRCVEYARRYGVPIHVRSSFSDHTGTLVDGRARRLEGEDRWSSRSSPASRTTAARPRSPSSASPTCRARPPRIFEVVAGAGVNIDMIVQNVSAAATGLTDISFTLPADRRRRARTTALDASTSRTSASRRCSTTTRSASSRSSAPA